MFGNCQHVDNHLGVPWPMWRQNPMRTGGDARPILDLNVPSLVSVVNPNSQSTAQYSFSIGNKGGGELVSLIQRQRRQCLRNSLKRDS